MNIQELINLTDTILYSDSPSYKQLESKQKELLQVITPHTNIRKIDVNVINKYLLYLRRKGNKPATINSKMSYLSSILHYAYYNGYIGNKPFIPFERVKACKDKFLSSEEVQEIIDYCTAHDLKELYQIIQIGLNTGLRIDNILSIKPEDIDNNYLRVWQNKTNHPYSIPLNKSMQDLFKDFTGFTLNYQQVYYQFKVLKQSLQLDSNVTIHTLRHTFCSNLIQKGVPVAIIQKLANHQNIQTTMRYAHLSNAALEKAINLL
jgi:site-specific recombinase XerD